MTNPNNTVRANSIRIIGNKKTEFFNECNNMEFDNITRHDKPTMDVKTFLGLDHKVFHATKMKTFE